MEGISFRHFYVHVYQTIGSVCHIEALVISAHIVNSSVQNTARNFAARVEHWYEIEIV